MATPTPQELETLKSLATIPTPDEAATLKMLAQGQALPTPGIPEAVARGLEQGATFGFGDEINGGLSTLLDTLAGRNKNLSLTQDYQQQRDASRKAMDAASAAHPYVSGAANLLGAIAPAALTGGASLAEEGLAGAAKAGAKYGALAGLGNSDADLTKGDIAGNLKDAAIGSVAGAATAPVATAAMQALAPALGSVASGATNAAETLGGVKAIKTPLSAFDQGLQGVNVIGTKGAQNAQEIALNAASPNRMNVPGNIPGDLQRTANQYGSQKLGLLQNAAPMTPDEYLPWVQQAQKAIANAQEGANGTTGSGLPVINKLIEDTFFTPVQNGEGGTTLAPKPQISMLQMENFKQTLGKLGSAEFANGMSDPTAEALVNRLVSPSDRPLNFQEHLLNLPQGIVPLNTFMNEAVPGLDEINANLSSVLGAIQNTPSIDQLVPAGKQSLAGSDALGKMLESLRKNPENADLADRLENTLGNASTVRNLAKTSNETGLSQGIVGDTVRGIATTGANAAGLTLRGLYNAAPEAVKTLGQAISARAPDLGEAASRLGSVLTQAADRDPMGRNALLFAIEQNPQYRDVLRKMNDTHTAQ